MNSTLNNQTMSKSMNGLNVVNADEITTDNFSATTLSATNLTVSGVSTLQNTSTTTLTATGGITAPSLFVNGSLTRLTIQTDSAFKYWAWSNNGTLTNYVLNGNINYRGSINGNIETCGEITIYDGTVIPGVGNAPNPNVNKLFLGKSIIGYYNISTSLYNWSISNVGDALFNNLTVGGTLSLPSSSISDSALSSNVVLKNAVNSFTPASGTDAIQIVKYAGGGGYVFINSAGNIGYWNGTSGNWNIQYNGVGELNSLTLTGGGLTATASQTINFGTNAPYMLGTNITGIPVAAITGLSYVDLSSPQTVGGVKTFTSLPVCSVVPTTTYQLTNKTYVDSNFCNLTTAQNIDGIKTFFRLNPVNASGTAICIGRDVPMVAGVATNSIFIGSNPSLPGAGNNTLNCIGIGALALSNSNTTEGCISIGIESLLSATSSQFAIAIGSNCCDQGNPSDVVSIGKNCARYLTTSDNNVFMGNGCFPVGSKASQFTAIGSGALYSYSSTGGDVCNTAIGSFALASLASGSNNAGVGSGAGGGLQTNCDYNFSAGSQSMSTAYTAPVTQQQYTGVSTPVATTTYTLGANANIKAGQLCVANFGGVASRTTVVSWNGSTLVLLAAVQMTQNSYFYFYPYGTLITTGSYAGATATSTTFTISTGLTSAIVGERCVFRSSATQTNYGTVSLYSPATGVIVFTTSITLFGSSTLEFWNDIKLIGNNVDNLTALGAFSIQNFTSNASFNTAFGAYSLNGGAGGYDGISYLSGNNNTGIGNGAGKILSGSSSKNTFLGAGTDVASRDLNYIQHSTAVGADAKINRSNQIKLGTTADTTTVDGILECVSVLSFPTNQNVRIGTSTTNTGINSVQIGKGTVIGNFSSQVCIGDTTTANKDYACAIGLSASATGISGVAIGHLSGAGIRSVAIGKSAAAGYDDSVAIGNSAAATAAFQIALGTASNNTIIRGTAEIIGTLFLKNAFYPYEIYPSNLTADTVLTTPLYENYIITATGNITITLPVITSSLYGITIQFRKLANLGGTIYITSSTGNTYYPINSITALSAGALSSGGIIPPNTVTGRITCISATSWAITT